MATTTDKQVVIDFSPYFRLYDDHTIHRFQPTNATVAPPQQNHGAVPYKDVTIDSETNLSIRIFTPPPPPTHQQTQTPAGSGTLPKLPLLFYVHGGAFCVGSAKNPIFHNFVSTLVEKSNLIAVSVEYRLAPEHPLPAAFDDSWAAFQYVASHAGGNGPDETLNERVDYTRVFLGGESAGACIVNDVALRAGVSYPSSLSPKLNVVGMFLAHPFFGGKKVDRLYKFLCPESSGKDDDPRLNPAVDSRIGRMAGRRVLFMVAENDFLKNNAMGYYEGLKKSEWKGDVEFYETEGEGHCFYLYDLKKEKAMVFVDRLVQFLTTW